MNPVLRWHNKHSQIREKERTVLAEYIYRLCLAENVGRTSEQRTVLADFISRGVLADNVCLSYPLTFRVPPNLREERSMRKPALCFLLLLSAGACAADPTGAVERPAHPRYDGGGWTIGSGKSDSTVTPMTVITSQEACTTTATGGGWTIGSGITQPSDPCPVQ